MVRIRFTLKGVAATRGRHSPSVARSLSALEAADLAWIATALPPDWVVTVEPPFGQLAISPANERRRHHRCWVASPRNRTIFRDAGWRPR
jgi:hypothetical protein